MQNGTHNNRSSTRRRIKRIITAPFLIIAAAIVLFEDWLWDDLARLAAAIGKLPVLRQLEVLVASLPPYAALFFFLVPSTLLIPVKLIALYFVGHGHAIAGLLTIMTAKVAGTALIARLFTLTRPNLLRIVWFAWMYVRFVSFKQRIYATLKATSAYRLVHRKHLQLKEAFRAWKLRRKSVWQRRWRATLKFARQSKE